MFKLSSLWFFFCMVFLLSTEMGIGFPIPGGRVGSHLVKRGYDHRMFTQLKWNCRLSHLEDEDAFGKDRACKQLSNPLQPLDGVERVSVWQLGNDSIVSDPARQSFLHVEFLSGVPARREDGSDLLEYCRKMHPGMTWVKVEDSDFVSYRAEKILSTEASEAFEYHLVTPGQVVAIHMRKDNMENGASQVDFMVSTIGRQSAGPKIREISTENPEKQLQVGENVCYRIFVDDLEAHRDIHDISAFDIKGISPFANFMSVGEWNDKSQFFRLCMPVTRSFGEDGLGVTSLVMKNIRGRVTTCAASELHRLRCGTSEGKLTSAGGNSTYEVPVNFPALKIADPDVLPPKFVEASITDGTELRVVLDDASPISSVKLHIDFAGGYATEEEAQQADLLLLPEDIQGNIATFDLKRVGEVGWNMISSIAAVDIHGHAAMLYVPKERKDDKYKYAFSKVENATDSTISVLSYLRRE